MSTSQDIFKMVPKKPGINSITNEHNYPSFLGYAGALMSVCDVCNQGYHMLFLGVNASSVTRSPLGPRP